MMIKNLQAWSLIRRGSQFLAWMDGLLPMLATVRVVAEGGRRDWRLGNIQEAGLAPE